MTLNKALGDALQNIGTNPDARHREYHRLMRKMNGDVPLRGLVTEQLESTDDDVRDNAEAAFKLSEGDTKLLINEVGSCIDTNGKIVFKGHPASRKNLE